MSLQNLTRFPRLELIGAPTPLEYLPRPSDHLCAKFLLNVMIRRRWRWGNKLRKLEFSPMPMLRARARIP